MKRLALVLAACGSVAHPRPPTPRDRAAELDRARHFADALALYIQACAAGDGAACTRAGVMTERGRGSQPDATRAQVLYAQAA